MAGYVDKYGRSRPNGTRRVHHGSIQHDGRPLPFELQVRPQKAEPVRRATGTHKPWARYFGLTYHLLLHGEPTPFLMPIDYTSLHAVELNLVIVYKISVELTCADAFGVCEALSLYYDEDYGLVLLVPPVGGLCPTK